MTREERIEKKILSNVKRVQKRGVKTRRGDFGDIKIRNLRWVADGSVCPLASCILFRKAKSRSFTGDIQEFLGISYEEFNYIWDGFDSMVKVKFGSDFQKLGYRIYKAIKEDIVYE